jgi:hypothetical protein
MIEFANGTGAMPEFVNEDRYIDLAQEFSKTATFTDFEGFASPDHTESILTNLDVLKRLEDAPSCVRDLLAHYVYEMEDQGDYQIDVEEACVFIDTMVWLLNSRFWLRQHAK